MLDDEVNMGIVVLILLEKRNSNYKLQGSEENIIEPKFYMLLIVLHVMVLGK